MPVKAEWPRASEKKDIRLWTTMVDRMPNRGEMTSTASRAFFMKYMESGLGPLKGQQVHQCVPELHHACPPFPTRRWKVS